METDQEHLSEMGAPAEERYPHKLLLSPEEVAHSLGIGRTKVYELMASGRLASVTIGRLRRVPTLRLVEFVATLGSEES